MNIISSREWRRYLYTIDPQSVVHNRPWVVSRPHPAGASVVVQGVREVSDGTLPVLVAVAEETNKHCLTTLQTIPIQTF